MSNSQSWDITDDTSLKRAVRQETQYDESKLSEPDIDGLVDSAKRVLALKADVTAFYDDRGIAVALQGIVCAKAKGAVENSPVQVKNLGTEDVTFRTSDGESLQLAEYTDMVRMGLANAETTDAGNQGIELTHTHYSNSSANIVREDVPEQFEADYYSDE
jgi:hypothetical protein